MILNKINLMGIYFHVSRPTIQLSYQAISHIQSLVGATQILRRKKISLFFQENRVFSTIENVP